MVFASFPAQSPPRESLSVIRVSFLASASVALAKMSIVIDAIARSAASTIDIFANATDADAKKDTLITDKDSLGGLCAGKLANTIALPDDNPGKLSLYFSDK